MVLRNLILVVLAAFFTVACETSDEVTPIAGYGNIFKQHKQGNVANILSVTVDPSYSTDQSDDWLVISGPRGKILGFKNFETNTAFEIEAAISDLPDRVNVSLLQVFFSIARTTYTIQSYSNIPVGTEWHIKRLIEKKRNSLGTISVNILNSAQPDLTFYTISDNFGGQSYSSSWSPAKNLATFNFTLFEDVSKIMITLTSPENRVKYLEIENPNVLLNYTYDYNTDFVMPDYHTQILLVPNSFVSASIRGLNDLAYNKSIQLKGLGLTEIAHLNGTDKLALGYNTGYNFYYTEMKVNMPDYHYRYVKLGDPPDLAGFSVSPNPVKWINQDFDNFELSSGEDYDHLQTLWENNQPFNGMEHVMKWYIHSPGTSYPNFLGMPEEIKLTYPFLDFEFDQMKLNNLTLFRNIQGYSYEEKIEYMNRNNPEDYPRYEYEKISINLQK